MSINADKIAKIPNVDETRSVRLKRLERRLQKRTEAIPEDEEAKKDPEILKEAIKVLSLQSQCARRT